MFLSQLIVNPGSHPDQPRPGVAWANQTYRIHQRIWMAFPDSSRVEADPFFLGTWSSRSGAKPPRSECGFLFRVEPDPPLRILVQSALRPDWNYAFQNAPYLLSGSPQVREFEPSLTAGENYRFRLVLQMVTRRTIPKALAVTGVKRRSEHPIRCVRHSSDGAGISKPDPEFTQWRDRLDRLARQSGFELGEYPRYLRVQPVTNLFMKPEIGKEPRRFNAALFEGVLTCRDENRLRDAVVNGIGRGKAFGMGLLSIAALR